MWNQGIIGNGRIMAVCKICHYELLKIQLSECIVT